MNMYLTFLEHPEHDERYNPYDGYHHRYILRAGWQWDVGRFPTLEKVDEFLTKAGCSKSLIEEKHMRKAGMFRKWKIDRNIDQFNYFSSVDTLPDGVVKFTGLSNGSLVDCYLFNDGETLHIFRPNPNIEAIYNPLSIEEHVTYCRENGYV